MGAIPGGFPVAKRTPNAGQIRVTPTALTAISADPAKVIGPLVGNAMNGIITFPVPGSCGGNPEICCVNNMPAAMCGPLEIDLVKRPTDQPRLVLTPVQGASRLDMTIRAIAIAATTTTQSMRRLFMTPLERGCPPTGPRGSSVDRVTGDRCGLGYISPRGPREPEAVNDSVRRSVVSRSAAPPSATERASGSSVVRSIT